MQRRRPVKIHVAVTTDERCFALQAIDETHAARFQRRDFSPVGTNRIERAVETDVEIRRIADAFFRREYSQWNHQREKSDAN